MRFSPIQWLRAHQRGRLLSVIMAICVVITAGMLKFTVSRVHAASYCNVTYTVSNQWQGGFGANIVIQNTGSSAWTSWTLAFTFPASGQAVTQGWNATFTQSGQNVTVTNMSYNGNVAVNGSVNPGFNGSWTSSNPVPTSFSVNGNACGGTTPSTPTNTPTLTNTPVSTNTPTPTNTSSPTNTPGQATYYVSPSGSDSNPGTLSAPFQTLTKAQSVVRSINSNMQSDIYVYLRGGVYPISSTVAFTPQDSGTNGKTIYYQAYPGETPILSAGTSVTGWTQYSGSIYQAHLSRSTTLRSLYVNDHRAVMDSKTITSQGCSGTYSVSAGQASWAWVSGSQADGVLYNQSDLPTISKNQNDVEISNSTTWNQNFVAVRGITTNGNHWVLQLQQPYGAIAQQIGYGAGFSCGSGTQHTIWNAFELLNTPGQFYFDKSTQTLYYDKLSNENMATATVFAPTGLTTLLTIAGTSTTNRVQNLTLSELTFAYTDWNLQNVGGSVGKATVQGSTVSIAFAQGNWHNDVYRSIDTLPAAVMVDNSQNIQFVKNTFEHTGADALAYRNDVVNSQIVGNHITDIGASALTLDYPQHVYIGDGGTNEKFPAGVEGVVSKTVVKDNTITNTATLFAGSSAVAAFFVNGLDFEHNVLTQTTWNGLSLGWGWHNFNGASDSVFPGKPTTAAGNNTVNNNAFFRMMQTLGDSGPIYTIGAEPNTTMSGNYMQGINGGYGFHLDEGSAYITVSNTVLDIGSHYTYNAENYGQKHDLRITATYSTNSSVFGGSVPPNSTYDPLMVYTPSTWPTAALNIIHNAGLEPGY
jgi:Cellulose binding domain